MATAGTGRPGRSNAVEASLLLGHQWTSEQALLSVFVGPELDHRSRNAARSTALGLRVLAEIWAQPTPDTFAATTLLVGTEPLRVWSRHALGWRMVDRVFVGPEVVLAVEEHYSEARLGLHATGLAIGPWSFSLSGGFLAAQDREPQGYVGVTTVLKL
jgi:hypothetical protein